MVEIQKVHEQVLVNAIRSESNGKASALIDAFSGWLLGGLGAASALLIGQYESVSKHLDPAAIHWFLYLFVWALGFGISQKFLAVIVGASAQASAVGRDLAEKAAAKGIELDLEFILDEMERTVLPPARWFVSRSFAKIRNGDLVSGIRNVSRVQQIQGLLTLLQAGLTFAAIYKIAFALHI